MKNLLKVSIIIPTFNCSHLITMTLDKVLLQQEVDWEVLIIDGGSIDRTLEVVKSYNDDRIKICIAEENSRYQMINEGISKATGDYLNFLFPGDFYIHARTLLHMTELATNNDLPDLLYGGSLIRDGYKETKVLFRPFTLELLKVGQQPSSLQACFFKKEVFNLIGKFSVNYKMRGGYDLFCRFLQYPHLRTISTKQVITDYDLRGVSKKMILEHFVETSQAVKNHFGWLTWFKWLYKQKDLSRWLKCWARSLHRT